MLVFGRAAVQGMSLDEAALDVTEYVRRTGADPAGVAEEIRMRVFRTTGLTCSAGIACNPMLAKICSNRNKPNGQFCLRPERQSILDFLFPLEARKIPGIGKVTNRMLEGSLGVHTIRDLFEARYMLSHLFSESYGGYMLRASLGVAHCRHGTPEDRKSVSHERTFRDNSSPDELLSICSNLSALVAEELQDRQLRGRTVTVKMKLDTFQIKQRSQTLLYDVSSQADIYRVASQLLRKEFPVCLRLLGVRISQLRAWEGSQVRPSVCAALKG